MRPELAPVSIGLLTTRANLLNTRDVARVSAPARPGPFRSAAGLPRLGTLLAGLWLLAACGSDPGTDRASQAQGAGASGVGGGVAPPFACMAGARQACFCPDGSQSGQQDCLPDNTLGPCQGCRTAGTLAETPTLEVIEDGALCPMLAGQSGCLDQSFRSDDLPASILFLVDRSGSMLCNPPESGQTSEECEAMASTKFPDQPTKWDITVSALRTVIDGLVNSGASAGLAVLSNNDVCGVHSAPAVPIAAVDASQATALAGALDATTPGGGTPIVGGTILAYAHLHAEAGLDASGGCVQPPCGAPGNRFVVLITDGADSCPAEPFEGACNGGACTDFLLDESVHRATGVNIRTFVIGAPGSEAARGFLSELARSGGTGRNGGACSGERASEAGDCHFDMTTSTDFAADLSGALEAISGSAIGCEFAVPPTQNGVPTDNVNVQYRPGGTGDPVCLGFDAAPCDAGANGWQFGKLGDGSDDLAKVVLCGEACRTVQADAQVQVDVVLGCQPLVLD